MSPVPVMHWSGYLLPIALTIVAWWGSTAVIARLVGRAPNTYPSLLVIASALGLAGFAANVVLRDVTTPAAALAGFLAALFLWGWIEVTFLTGAVTGPPRTTLPRRRGWGRALDALRAILWHELLIVAIVAVVAVTTVGRDNDVTLLVLLLLWLMRTSAKLNLFLGVRNLGAGFLPPHLVHLLDFMQERRMNILMPASLLLGAALMASFGRDALSASTAFDATVGSLLATLALLATIEHLFMILPLPAEALWRWSLANRRPSN